MLKKERVMSHHRHGSGCFTFRPKMHVCKILLVVFLSLNLSGCIINDIPSGTGYTASNMCTGVFLSGIDEDRMANDYIATEVAPLPMIWEIDVDDEAKKVTVWDRIFRDRFEQTAVYRDGLGCSLIGTKSVDDLMAQVPDALLNIELPGFLPWPHGSAGVYPIRPRNVDIDAVNSAIDQAFLEDREALKNTVAVAIVYDGKLIAERYADGFTAQTPIIGWSMSKSVTSALIGIQKGWGMLDVTDDALFDEWIGTDRDAITIENLLQMSSGLDYLEASTGDQPDQALLLYSNDDHAAFMLSKELAHEPGTVWNYSTGDTQLLSKIVQDNVGGELKDSYAFIQQELFHKIDIAHAVAEYDPSGTFIGGARMAMPARDWARMGQLYLQDGVWNGEQILPQGWVDYATTPASTNSSYGAQIWLNTNLSMWPDLPLDTYGFRGYQGQNVIIVPSKKLVVVRMGYTFSVNIDPNAAPVEPTEQLVAEVIAAIQ